jgi:hypothetical protein
MNNFNKMALACIVLSSSLSSAYADTTAFGMTLGKTTLDEFKKAYPSATDEGVNQWSDGYMFSIPPDDLNFGGVEGDTVIFGKDEKVVAILFDLKKDRFKEVQKMLANKYKVVKKEIPFVGDSYVRYKSGNDVIELDAPHMSFRMQLRYMDNGFENAFLQQSLAEKEKKAANESNQL